MVSNRYSAPSVPGTAQRALSGLALSSLTESPRCIGTSVPRMASKIRIFDSGTRYASGLDNLAADHQNPLYESLMASTGAHRTERPLVVIVWSHDSPAEWNEARGCRRRRLSSPRARKFSFKGEPADYFHKVNSGPICSYRLFERWTPQPGLLLA